jgi:hypothetical protein
MKKYSDKFLNNINILKKSKIGMEFEFYMKDLSFFKTLELMNIDFSPVKVWGFRQYHSEFKPDELNFKIEPDLSGGTNLVELVTGPLLYSEAKYYLIKILNFIQNHGYTNDKCSIHFNISFIDDINLDDINILKLILNTDEDEIYRVYPTRKNNIYAKSIKKIIPYKEYDFFNIPISVVRNNIRIPNDKYYGINFSHLNNHKDKQRLEYRYIGGKDYHLHTGQVIYFMEKFIINTYNSIDSDFDYKDINILEEFLDENINKYKNFSKYDNFIQNYSTINIQIDQNSEYSIVSAYYDKIYHKLFSLIENTEGLQDCILNYVTKTHVLEIVNSNFKALGTIKNIDILNSNVSGLFEDCLFSNCEIIDSHLTKCKLHNSDATNSKVFNSHIDSSTLINCFFMDGYLDGKMIGGIFRSGELGPYADLDSDVKMITDKDNFFEIKYKEIDKGIDKKTINKFGK